MTCRAPKRPPFVEENTPGPDRKQPERRKNRYRYWSGARNEIDDARTGALRQSPGWCLHEQGDQRATERAQTALRDIAVRRWDSAIGETVACCEMPVKPMLRLEFHRFRQCFASCASRTSPSSTRLRSSS